MTDRELDRNFVLPRWSEAEVAALEESQDSDSECSLQVHLDREAQASGEASCCFRLESRSIQNAPLDHRGVYSVAPSRSTYAKYAPLPEPSALENLALMVVLPSCRSTSKSTPVALLSSR